MPRAASTCGHISDNSPGIECKRRPPKGDGVLVFPRRSGCFLLRPAFLLTCAVLIMAMLSGCASSSRFRIRSKAAQSAPPQYTKEIREEVREDDRAVDPAAVLPDVRQEPGDSWPDRSRLVHEINDMLGTPYNYSGMDKSGIDCSGFTSRVFSAFGRTLPHSTAEQFKSSHAVPDGKQQVGDLVFFNTTGQSPSHVGIYLGGGYFAHASVSYGVTISSLESSYYKARYIATRRVR